MTSHSPTPPGITVIGAGSWGTALAIQFARSGQATRLWGRDEAQLGDMQRLRCNLRYLPDARFPQSLQIANSLDEALAQARDVLVAVPSHALRSTLESLKPRLGATTRLAWATKGFEHETGKLPHQVAAEVLGADRRVAVLSGPTFAREVGAGLPTAMTIAARDESYARELAEAVAAPNFRAYTSTDIIGVEVGGAVKNALAVGAGLADGLGFGANTRIALITRGLAEMVRLGVALGGERDTFMGLAGLGDLVLTCTDDLSRNRRFGLLLASGHATNEALARIGQVVEGYGAARAVRAVATRHSVTMPIIDGIYATLYEGVPAREVVHGLMTRPIKSETA
ncbi:MAG: NAD(P)H-dependent glycerol-3-phosphate dehydrogenase [Steroidobacteraceae bacterium]